MPLEPSARRRFVVALLLALAILVPSLPASPAAPLGSDADGEDVSARLTFCSGTAVPRPAGGAGFSGAPFVELSRHRICFSATDLPAPARVEVRLLAGPTFSGEAFATFGEGSVSATFVAGRVVAGRGTATLEVPKGHHTLVLYAGYWAAMGQGGGTLRPLCSPPIEDPGCSVVVPIPFVWGGIGPLAAFGDVAAEVRPAPVT